LRCLHKDFVQWRDCYILWFFWTFCILHKYVRDFRWNCFQIQYFIALMIWSWCWVIKHTDCSHSGTTHRTWWGWTG
jgi:hypothetical protein